MTINVIDATIIVPGRLIRTAMNTEFIHIKYLQIYKWRPTFEPLFCNNYELGYRLSIKTNKSGLE